MPYYKTGISEVIQHVVNCSGGFRFTLLAPTFPLPIPPYNEDSVCTWTVANDWASATVGASFADTPVPGCREYTLGVGVEITTPDDTQLFIETGDPITVCSGYEYADVSCNVTIDFSVLCDLCWIIEEEDWLDYYNAPRECKGTLVWVAREGETATASVSGSVEGSVTWAVTTAQVIEEYLFGKIECEAYRLDKSYQLSPSYHVGYSLPTAYSKSEIAPEDSIDEFPGSEASCIINSVMVVRVFGEDATADGYSPATATAECTWHPERKFDLNGVVRAMEVAYPHEISFMIDDYADPTTLVVHTEEVAATAGAFSHHKTQRRWGAIATLNGIEQEPYAGNEYCPVKCRAKGGSLAANGENGSDLRAAFRGWRWNAVQIGQSASETLSDAFTRTNDTPYSLPDGETADTLTGSSFDGASGQGFRYLRFNLRMSTGGTVVCKIGTKEWTIAATTSDADYDLDLCSPTNATDETDYTQVYSEADGAYWGVDHIEDLVFEGIPVGETLTVNSAVLRRETFANASFLQGFGDVFYDEGTRYFLRGDTDGRVSLLLQDVVGSTPLSIAELVALHNATTRPQDGWTLTDLETDPSCSGNVQDLFNCYANSARYAALLYGGGAIYHDPIEDEDAWEYGFDISAAGTLTVPAQAMVDEITNWTGYLGTGDVWGYGNANEEILDLRPAYIIRGQVEGLVLQENDAPAEDASVTVSSGTYGTGTTGEQGEYQSGTPFSPFGTRTVTAEVGETPYPELEVVFANRWRRRACFRVAPTEAGDYISYDVSASKRHVRVFVREETIWLGFAANADGESWTDDDTEIDGTYPEIRYERNSTRQRLYLHYRDADDALIRLSTDDEGLTWNSPMTLTTDILQHCFLCDEDGTTFVFYLKDDVIYCQILDAFDTVIKAEFTVIGSGVADKEIACRHFRSGGGNRVVKLQYYNTSDALISVNSTDGVTYS